MPAPFSLLDLSARVDEFDELLSDLEALTEHYEKAARDAAIACERFKLEAKKADRMLHAARQKSVDLCRRLRQAAKS